MATWTIDATKKFKSSYNMKGYDRIEITNLEHADEESFLGGIKNVVASGSTLTVTLNDNRKLKFTNIANPNGITLAAIDSVMGYNDTVQNFYDTKMGDDREWLKTPSSTSAVGTVFDEDIDLTGDVYVPVGKNSRNKKGVTINAGGGNDTITGTHYNDVISGGLGNNTVVYDYHNGVQGQDVINLTKGENLIIDLTGYGIPSVDGFLGLGGGRFKKSGKDLILRLSESTDVNADYVKIKNFYKTNGVGDNGSVKVLLKNESAPGANDAEICNLNTAKLFTYSDTDFTPNTRKKTLMLTGSRFNEELNITSEQKDYTKTVKMGAGVNKINITSADFGKLILAEEKVNATNIINLDSDDYEFTKSGNDLIVSNENSELKITGYYLARTDKTKYADIQFKVNGVDIDLDELQEIMNITGKGKLFGTDGDDRFVSSTKNDTITGLTGENTIVFNGKFGKDTVNLTEGERLVLDMSSYNLSEDSRDLRFSFSKGNLVISVYDYKTFIGQVTVKNFAKSNVVGNDTDANNVTAGVFLKLSNTKTLDLNEKLYVVETNSSYTGTRFDEEIDVYSGKSTTITGGKGNDRIYSGEGAVIYMFNEGDGNDILYATKKSDVIKINTKGNVDYDRVGDDLIISYGENDSVKIYGYFYESDSRIDKIYTKNAAGSYVLSSLAEKTGASESDATTYNVSLDYGSNENKHVIQTTDEYNTVRFINHGSFSYGPGNDTASGETADDLVIKFDALNANWDDRVVLKGYMNGESPVTKFIINNKIYDIPYHVGTAGNDTFGSGGLRDEYYYLYGGNDTITFEGDFGEYNHIYSQGTKSSATDTLYFKDLSFEDGDLNIERTYSGIDDELTINYSGGEVIYYDYFSDNTPAVELKDKDGALSLGRSNNSADIDWSAGDDADKNHVLFVDFHEGQITKTINSNAKTNLIDVAASNGINDDYDTKLNYTYNGGNDVIRTNDYYAADTYNIASFTADSKLSVFEGGSDGDTVSINASSSDMYLLFNVTSFGGQRYYDDWGTAIVHKDAMTVETLREFFENYNYTDATIAGVLKFCGGGWSSSNNDVMDTHDYGSTIEYFRTNDISGRLDIASWKQKVAERVYYWLENNLTTGGKNLAFNYHNIVNVINKVAKGEITLTDSQYQSLLNCFKVNYYEVFPLEINELAGSRTILKTDGYTIIKFTNASNPDYVHFNRIPTSDPNVMSNDLKVEYGDYTVTLKDYFTENYPTKYFKVSDYEDLTYEIPYKIGTTGADSFNTREGNDEYFYLNGGNDTIIFNEEYYAGTHDIISSGTSENTTTVQLNQYALENDNIKFNYIRYGAGTDPTLNRLDIDFAKDDSTVPGGHNFGNLSYKNYFNDTEPKLIIVDKESTYSVDKETEIVDYNWLEDANEADKNHVAFLFGTGENTIVSNGQTNQIYVTEYTHNLKLDYTYVGGQDKVTSKAWDNDIYRVNSFDDNTKLVINDQGGDDTLNINANKNDIRLFFDVVKRVDADNNWVYTASSDSALVSASAANVDKLTEYLDKYLNEQWVEGAVSVRVNEPLESSHPLYNTETGRNIHSGIETFTATDGAINLDAWKDEIAQNVCAWFTEFAPQYQYSSLSDAIEQGAVSGEALETLIGYYNTPYNPA